MTLTLNNTPIAVSPARRNYNTTRLKYLALAKAASAKFTNSYTASFKSIDDVHERCTEIAYSYIREAVEAAIQDLVKLGIYDVDADGFAEFLEPYFTWPEDFAKIDDAYMEIVLKAEELDAYRSERRESRGRWVGGGFGFSGAVKGAMQAGAMNIATGAVHGIFNLGAKAISAAGDAIKKSELFKNPETQAHLTASVHRAVFNVHMALVDAANKSKPDTFSDLVTEEARTRATRLLQNVESGRLPTEAVQNALLEAVNLDPYNENFYRLWLDRFGDQHGQLETVEVFFGIAVVGRAKKELIAARKSALDFSTPQACDASLDLLRQYAESIGYAGFDKEQTAILAEKSAREQEQRTVAGVAYQTEEQAADAKDRLARTVRGVTYATHAEAEEARAQKVVGPGFYLALLFLPYVTPFFTLRKGYSKKVRLISFSWLIAVAIIMHYAK